MAHHRQFFERSLQQSSTSKRARKTVAKMVKLHGTEDFDIETLEARGHWATMEELLKVLKFHLPRYVEIFKPSPAQEPLAQVNPSDLTFATKFVAMYLFIKVKRVMSHDLSICDGGHDYYRYGKGWIYWSGNLSFSSTETAANMVNRARL